MEGSSNPVVGILTEKFRATISDPHRTSVSMVESFSTRVGDRLAPRPAVADKYQEEIEDCFNAVAQVHLCGL